MQVEARHQGCFCTISYVGLDIRFKLQTKKGVLLNCVFLAESYLNNLSEEDKRQLTRWREEFGNKKKLNSKNELSQQQQQQQQQCSSSSHRTTPPIFNNVDLSQMTSLFSDQVTLNNKLTLENCDHVQGETTVDNKLTLDVVNNDPVQHDVWLTSTMKSSGGSLSGYGVGVDCIMSNA